MISTPGCTIKSLPPRLHAYAAEVAREIVGPQRIGVAIDKYWGAAPRIFTVGFLEPVSVLLRDRILGHMNAWADYTCLSFEHSTIAPVIRISLEGDGYWSYVGTDVLHVPPGYPTMNLEGFTMDTPDSEYRRVVRHETGHTLGFPHEHMRRDIVARIDPAKAYPYFRSTQGWGPQAVDDQVLTPLDEANLLGTPPDQDSVMCYQLPASITIDGLPVVGGMDINLNDAVFAARLYPPAPPPIVPHDAGHWPEAEDVAVDPEIWT